MTLPAFAGKGRDRHGMVSLEDGNLYVFGGRDYNGTICLIFAAPQVVRKEPRFLYVWGAIDATPDQFLMSLMLNLTVRALDRCTVKRATHLQCRGKVRNAQP